MRLPETILKITACALAVGCAAWCDDAAGQPPGMRAIPASGSNGYEGVLDRLTAEFLVLLEKDDLLVVWCFDESESMRDDQKELRVRIGRLYEELSLARIKRVNPVVTSVVSFGETVHMQTRRPTADIKDIQNAIDMVPVDKSGKERMCLALHRAITVHRMQAKQERRKMALVLVTDESGDRQENSEQLETVVKLAKEAACSIYVLGREAVFGSPYARVRWTHPVTKRQHWLRIDRGPETAFVQLLQTDGFGPRRDALSSGFGPYEQLRLVRETNGIFFALPSDATSPLQANRRRYVLKAMVEYRPDLRSRAEIMADFDKSPLRQVLGMVIHDFNPYEQDPAKPITLKTEFKDPEQMKVALKSTERHLRKLQGAVEMLESFRGDRNQETSRRWQANYDLTVAQLITFQARVREYRAQLRAFIDKPRTAPATKGPNLAFSCWTIDPAKQTIDEERSGPLIKQAEELLQAIIKEHAGTPWAAQAELELRRGFGMRIAPQYHLPVNDLQNTPPPIF